MRRWNKRGFIEWVPPITAQDMREMEEEFFGGKKRAFANVPPNSDTSNVEPFPLQHRERRKRRPLLP